MAFKSTTSPAAQASARPMAHAVRPSARVLHVRAQHTVAARRDEQPRAVQAASTLTASPQGSMWQQHQHQSKQEQNWLDWVTKLFKQEESSSEEAEFYRQFGHLLDPSEEKGASHSMYMSHIAERLATEPRQ